MLCQQKISFTLRLFFSRQRLRRMDGSLVRQSVPRLYGSVGRAPAQSVGGRRFDSRLRAPQDFSLFHVALVYGLRAELKFK